MKNQRRNYYGEQKCNRSNKDSARFAEAFENAACRNPKTSWANLIFWIMSGEGCFSYKTDLEFAMDLRAFHGEGQPSVGDLMLAFGFPKDMQNKIRTVDQNAKFAKMLKHALKHNPQLRIGEILGDVVMGKNYCSYHSDKDLIERMERVPTFNR